MPRDSDGTAFLVMDCANVVCVCDSRDDAERIADEMDAEGKALAWAVEVQKMKYKEKEDASDCRCGDVHKA